jgi:hypothetical protein
MLNAAGKNSVLIFVPKPRADPPSPRCFRFSEERPQETLA